MVEIFDSGRFTDRTQAGEELAEELLTHEVEADVVLAIPRGGLPVGRAVADALDLPLDIAVASKIGAPGNPELAIGAVASDGSAWLDREALDLLDVSEAYVEEQRELEATTAADKSRRYRGDRGEPDIAGLTVLLVDDGVATGSTAIAAIRLLRERGAERVILAIPVGPSDTVAKLEREADEIICLRMPPSFGAVGQYYVRFDQISDEQAIQYLEAADGDGPD